MSRRRSRGPDLCQGTGTPLRLEKPPVPLCRPLDSSFSHLTQKEFVCYFTYVRFTFKVTDVGTLVMEVVVYLTKEMRSFNGESERTVRNGDGVESVGDNIR